jgi:hypothetical protein
MRNISVSRTAEHSIRGYLYQFLRYLSEILDAAPGTQISIEGVVEDVDVMTSGLTTAIQCKLHEQADKFTLGKIYKPVLQMLEHFGNSAPGDPEIQYRLFCHFPDRAGSICLTLEDMTTIESTTSEPLKKIISRIPAATDRAAFLACFTIEFGPCLDDLEQQVLAALAAKGFAADDITAFVYPNAVQRIVNLATRPLPEDRTVDATAFVQTLKELRHVTFTRWTLALKTRGDVLKKLRDNLSAGLALNSRSRFFVFGPAGEPTFDTEIVGFIKKFVEKYSSKYLHNDPPLFLLTDEQDVKAIAAQLYDAGVKATTGEVGGAFRAEELLRPCLRSKNPVAHEFRLRLATRGQLAELPKLHPDELILINVNNDPWERPGMTVHRIRTDQIAEIEYAFQLRKSYA